MKLMAWGALSTVAFSQAMQQTLALTKPPNFLFILTDDQDLQLNSPAYTPQILRHVKEKGLEFTNHFVTTSLCCPSRVSLWTGRQAHNTNVTDVKPPWGGYPKFVSQGFNDDWFPVWLQQSGYNTFYTGKLFNSHSVTTYNDPFVKGFNGSDFLLDPHTYSYYNSTYQRNRDAPRSYPGQHTTDIITEKALGFLDDALHDDRPFFLTVAPIAPHSNIDALGRSSSSPVIMTEPIPAPRHAHLFSNATVPRTPNFNPTTQNTGVSWISGLPLQNQSVIDYEDHFYRQRLRALQGVDELVERLVRRLEDTIGIENTYIIYTSDNGFHIGQHRLPPGKTTGFEEDIRVPFYIRGPGVPAGKTQDSVSTHIDLVPTFLELAGIPLRQELDGTPMSVREHLRAIKHEHVTVEFWGHGVLEGELATIGNGSTQIPKNTYKSTRIIGEGYNLYYSVWCTNEHELYDLSLPTVIHRLDALLLVLKSCKGETCIKPWDVLHPDGSVRSLQDALDPRFDAFYVAQPKLSFETCLDGYILGNEGEQVGFEYRDGLEWDAWT
ncbi:hypothetical protein EYZ11_010997 [Aspergillus tanneri]|uniref:Sulfatase N-terminal domain-containing protein n=1 Tax=Aspergillus tanneri TaxID=1220188 RepID=A0A4S3J3X1_9EURO|nr:hypothetical protein EYZ11_010997 [Aspergillus tanneri]